MGDLNTRNSSSRTSRQTLARRRSREASRVNPVLQEDQSSVQRIQDDRGETHRGRTASDEREVINEASRLARLATDLAKQRAQQDKRAEELPNREFVVAQRENTVKLREKKLRRDRAEFRRQQQTSSSAVLSRPDSYYDSNAFSGTMVAAHFQPGQKVTIIVD